MDVARWGWALLVGIGVGGCHETFVDLTPDFGADVPGADADPDATTDGLPPMPPRCGNGDTDPGEDCDDGNRMNGDGCTWDCRFGDGDPPGPADPTVRMYEPAGAPVILPAVAEPPQWAVPLRARMTAGGAVAAGWVRGDAPRTAVGPTMTARFLAMDGSAARADVVADLPPGSFGEWLSGAVRGEELLVAWDGAADGIWRGSASLASGVVIDPARLSLGPDARSPAVDGVADGFAVAWQEGSDSRSCWHDAGSANRVFVRRLGADGNTWSDRPSLVLEEPRGSSTPPDVAAGDGGVGLLWWRAGRTADEGCVLRFGVADPDLAAVRDGGTLGAGDSARVVAADGGYRVGWIDAPPSGPFLAFAAFDGRGVLLGPPVVREVAAAGFAEGVQLAAGDRGLVAVTMPESAAGDRRLLYARADLLGRPVGRLAPVDPACSSSAGCHAGSFDVVWTGEAFVVLYFVTDDPSVLDSPAEMRMVRLVPAE